MSKEEIQKNSEHWYNKYKDAEKRIEELENQNKLLGERCNQLLKDKGELTDQIADIKANCDLAIKGRDIEIKELEQQIEQIQDAKCTSCTDLSGLQLKITELEKENERLKGDLELWESGGCRATNLFECGVVKELKEHHKSVCETLTNTHRSIREQLTKATEIIKKLKTLYFYPVVTKDDVKRQDEILNEAEQFLKGENIILEDVQAGNSPFDADGVFNKEIKAYPEEKVK